MEENLNPKPASKGDLPKDMWDDDLQSSEPKVNISQPILPKPAPPKPAPPKPAPPKPTPPENVNAKEQPTPPTNQPKQSSGIGVGIPEHHIGKRPSKFGWVPGFIFSVILILGAGYAGWYFWPNIVSWVDGLFIQVLEMDDPEDSKTITRVDDQIIWQDREQIENLGLTILSNQNNVPGALPVGGLGITAEYFKVGQFRDGSYRNGDVVIAYVHSTTSSGLKKDKFYRFAVENSNKITLLANHSPKLFEDDPMDDSRFIVDNDFVIESLIYLDEIGDSKFDNQPLRLIDAMPSIVESPQDKWFDDELISKEWRPAYNHDNYGALYTDPEPAYVPTLGPSADVENGFYFKVSDGSIKTYVISLENVFGSDFTSRLEGVPQIKWRIGGMSQEQYGVDDVGSCASINYASVMPNVLMNELIVASKDGEEPVVYELRDSNHEMLQEFYGYAQLKPGMEELSFEEFISSHPIFFWEDVFGRLLRFQNTQFSYQLNC